jgi:hypothetical protein
MVLTVTGMISAQQDFVAEKAQGPTAVQPADTVTGTNEQTARDSSPDASPGPADTGVTQPSFRFDGSGTLTFTDGISITGEIEKPQVMIFLPKEKPYYRDIEFSHSYEKEIMQPLPFQGVGDP